jgi:hypothetical protein
MLHASLLEGYVIFDYIRLGKNSMQGAESNKVMLK